MLKNTPVVTPPSAWSDIMLMCFPISTALVGRKKHKIHRSKVGAPADKYWCGNHLYKIGCQVVLAAQIPKYWYGSCHTGHTAGALTAQLFRERQIYNYSHASLSFVRSTSRTKSTLTYCQFLQEVVILIYFMISARFCPPHRRPMFTSFSY